MYSSKNSYILNILNIIINKMYSSKNSIHKSRKIYKEIKIILIIIEIKLYYRHIQRYIYERLTTTGQTKTTTITTKTHGKLMYFTHYYTKYRF